MSNKYHGSLDRLKIVIHNEWSRNYSKCKNEEKTIYVEGLRMFEIDGEAIKTLQELVDKENPKKVKIKEFDNGEYGAYCPSCNSGLPFHWKMKYCPSCGQKLDWSEE